MILHIDLICYRIKSLPLDQVFVANAQTFPQNRHFHPLGPDYKGDQKNYKDGMQDVVRELSRIEPWLVLVYYSKKVRLMEGLNGIDWRRSGQGLIPKKGDIHIGMVKRGFIEDAEDRKVSWVKVLLRTNWLEGFYGCLVVKMHR